MWSRLAEHAHLVAIDLPGFGHSERRNELLPPSTMAEFVVHAIEEFGLEQPHSVGPDIGTSTLLGRPVGIALAANGQLVVAGPYTVNPETNDFDGAVIAVNPQTGQQTLIARGYGNIVNPCGLTIIP